MSRLVCIVGLTASGKSSLALELAEGLGAELLSVDSMQVYRGFDVGTAKPTAEEQARVVHHGIDLVDPTERYSAGEFLTYARGVIDQAEARGVPVLAVGGTGLYLRAMLHGLAPLPPADHALRAEVRAEEDARPGAMHERLQRVDAEAAGRLHPNDLIRVERALEVFAVTGRTLGEWQAEHGFGEAPYETELIALRRPRWLIRERIADRVASMWAAGWPEEVRALRAAGLPDDAPALAAIGYRDVAAHLDGERDAAATIARIVTATRRFAKRQATWFNRAPSIRWVDPRPDLASSLMPRVRSFLEGS